MLVDQTGLTRSQVVNWFINARRRLIRPMKEQLEKQKEDKQRLQESTDNSSLEISVESCGSVDDNNNHYYTSNEDEPPTKKQRTESPANYYPDNYSEREMHTWKQPQGTVALQELEMSSVTTSPNVACYPPNVFTK